MLSINLREFILNSKKKNPVSLLNIRNASSIVSLKSLGSLQQCHNIHPSSSYTGPCKGSSNCVKGSTFLVSNFIIT